MLSYSGPVSQAMPRVAGVMLIALLMLIMLRSVVTLFWSLIPRTWNPPIAQGMVVEFVGETVLLLLAGVFLRNGRAIAAGASMLVIWAIGRWTVGFRVGPWDVGSMQLIAMSVPALLELWFWIDLLLRRLRGWNAIRWGLVALFSVTTLLEATGLWFMAIDWQRKIFGYTSSPQPSLIETFFALTATPLPLCVLISHVTMIALIARTMRGPASENFARRAM